MLDLQEGSQAMSRQVMEQKKLIILSHQGGSFIEHLVEVSNKLNLQPVIISSKCSNDDKIREKFYNSVPIFFSEEKNLTFNSTKLIITQNFTISSIYGFISVWEGYRILMSRLNKMIGACDVDHNTIQNIRDKLYVRGKLQKENLSNIQCEILSKASVRNRISKNKKSFIKPRLGLGSIGTKQLHSEDDINYVEKLISKIKKDEFILEAIKYNESFDFIVEDYIEGTEFSAEIVAVDSQLKILAIHEKVEIHKGIFTTTEPYSVSPPITSICLKSLENWISKVFRSLNINIGCYHIEFKYLNNSTIELIEINPRVGGAFIIESTNFVSGMNLLQLWVESLRQTGIHKGTIKLLYDEETQIKCAAFRVYFSETNGFVKGINYKYTELLPEKVKTMVSVGTELKRKDTEQYLGQALWVSVKTNMEEVLDFYNDVRKISTHFLKFDVQDKAFKEDYFFIIDYNLSRKKDVIRIADLCKKIRGLSTILFTTPGKEIGTENIKSVSFPNIRSASYIDSCISWINKNKINCRGGLVFSDDAIYTGSLFLSHLGCHVDSPAFAINSFDKLKYRITEAKYKKNSDRTPFFSTIDELPKDQLEHGWIIKPRCEGNNRGVIKVTNVDEFNEAIILNEKYERDGLIAEECIDIKEEYSVDGVSNLSFITKKITEKGKYPLEIGQISPAFIDKTLEKKIISASNLANNITGQYIGAFHNEIMIEEKTMKGVVAEPNRRPGGMKIWDIIENSFEIDLYNYWLRSAFEGRLNFQHLKESLCAKKTTGTLMLPGPKGQVFSKEYCQEKIDFFIQTVWNELGNIAPPNTLSTEILAENGFVFPDIIKDGHDFMLLVMFEVDSVSNYLERELLRFYACWKNNISALWQENHKGIIS